MKTPAFITAILLLGAPLFAQEPDAPPAPAPPVTLATDADAQSNAATVTLLLSGPWKISAPGWTALRIFDKDGTFYTRGKGRQRGQWQITATAVELIFMDGHKDTLTLPLNPEGTPGTGSTGGATTAVLVVDDAASVPAAETDPQPDNPVPAPPELLKLRQNYVDSLNDLLRQYTKDNNSAGVKAATQELDKLSPCGVWKWIGAMVKTATFHPDGTVTTNTKTEDRNSKDAWHWTDEINGKFQINWDSGWVDDVTLSPDGTTLLIKNNAGKQYTVARLSQVEPDGAGIDSKSPGDTSH